MKSISNIYHPITATPFMNDETYCEIAPCEALKPYIRCFWGTRNPIDSAQYTNTEYGLVIPDTCMDIIFNIDYTQNSYDDLFCTIDEHSYQSTSSNNGNNHCTATFAIRFYAWTAILFSEEDFRNSKNGVFAVETFYANLKEEIEPFLLEELTLYGKAGIAEGILLKHLSIERIDNNLMNAVYSMIHSSGRMQISDLCAYAMVSERKLERIFNYNMGVSPKAFSSLVRYQLLWQEMAFSKNFNMLDAVEKYGYTDYSHLLKDFKRRHFMLPKEAIAFARKTL